MHTHNMATSALTLKYTVFELKKPYLCEPCFLSEKTGLRLKQAPLQPCLSSGPSPATPGHTTVVLLPLAATHMGDGEV